MKPTIVKTGGPPQAPALGQILRAVGRLCALLLLFWEHGAARGASPSFVLILADDVGYGDLPCYGNPVHVTPALMSLANGGIRFTEFHTAGPGDSQTLYALLTGRSGARSLLPPALTPGVTNRLDPREWTLAGALAKAGYACSFIGAWRLGPSSTAAPAQSGFAHSRYLPWSPEYAPYPPLLAGSTLTDPAPDPAALLETMTLAAEQFILSNSNRPFFLLFHPPAKTGIGPGGTYIDAMAALDGAAGRLVANLIQANLQSNTLVLFLSDGGAMMASNAVPAGSNGGLRDARNTGWEGGLRVPCIAAWPGTIPPGQVSDAPWWVPDLLPTFALLAQAPLATNRPLDGVPSWDVLSGARTNALGTEQHAYHHLGENGVPLLALRIGPWKRHAALRAQDRENSFFNAAPPLLFNLQTDPFERYNVASQQPAVLASTAAAQQAWLNSLTPDPARLPASLPPFSSLSPLALQPGLQFEVDRPFCSYDFRYRLEQSTNLVDWVSLPLTPYVADARILSPAVERLRIVPPLAPGVPAAFYRLNYLP